MLIWQILTYERSHSTCKQGSQSHMQMTNEKENNTKIQTI